MPGRRCVLYEVHLTAQPLKGRRKPLVAIADHRFRECVAIGLAHISPRPARRRLTWILGPQDGRLADRTAEACFGPVRGERIVEVVQEPGEVVFVRGSLTKPALERLALN